MPVTANNWMVVTANIQASKAAAKILEKGGTAVDGMIAAQLVLGLVEPESSGLGGGAFLLYYDNGSKKITSLDGRETAPLKHFLSETPNPVTKSAKQMIKRNLSQISDKVAKLSSERSSSYVTL